MLRRRYYAKEKTAGKAERGQEADAPVRDGSGAQRGVCRCAEDGFVAYRASAFEEPPERCLCFTGHRLLLRSELPALSAALDAALAGAFGRGIRFFLSGGALGFDTLAARAVLRLREREPEAKLVLALPCRSQADRWSLADQAAYRSLLRQADRVIYVSTDYFEGCMQKRNRFLVEHASECVCFLRACRGGTWYTVSYAYDRGLTIHNLIGELR